MLYVMLCWLHGLNPKFTMFSKRQFKGNREKIDKASQCITEAARDFFEEKIVELRPKLDNLKNAL